MFWATLCSLTALARFFDLEPFPDWIKACSKLIWSEPQRTRDQVEWAPAVRERVERLIETQPDLKGFRFDGA